MDIKNIGANKLQSVLKNPFTKSCIKQVMVSYLYNDFDGTWIAYGSVNFVNGNTQGIQNFEGKNFDYVVAQVVKFIAEIEK